MSRKNKHTGSNGSSQTPKGNWLNHDYLQDFIKETGLEKDIALKVFDFFQKDIERNRARSLKSFLRRLEAVCITTEIPAVKAIALASQGSEKVGQRITNLRWRRSNVEADSEINKLFNRAAQEYITLANQINDLNKELEKDIEKTLNPKPKTPKTEVSSKAESEGVGGSEEEKKDKKKTVKKEPEKEELVAQYADPLGS